MPWTDKNGLVRLEFERARNVAGHEVIANDTSADWSAEVGAHVPDRVELAFPSEHSDLATCDSKDAEHTFFEFAQTPDFVPPVGRSFMGHF
jgi:hypothetical protein